MTEHHHPNLKGRQQGDDPVYHEQSPLNALQTTDVKPSTAAGPEFRNLEKAKHLLYISHCVATFAELGWQFCLILFLTALTNFKSFTLMASYGLFSGSIVSLSGTSAGAMIDNTQRNRLQTAKLFIWIQNLSVIVATTSCFFLLRSVNSTSSNTETNLEESTTTSTLIPDLAPPATNKTWMYIIAVHIFGAMGKLTDQSMTVALERDWIVVMSKVAGQENGMDSDESEAMTKSWLSQTNTAMKQIDLICKVLAPAAAGICFGFVQDDSGVYEDNNNNNNDNTISSKTIWNNLSLAAVIVGVLNIISLFVEILIIKHIYKIIPSLAVRKNRPTNNNIIVEDSNNQHEHKHKRKYLFLPRGLDIYVQQPVFFGGFAAAILYLNILSFGTMMTAYLVFRGMSYQSIGILKGFASTIGIMGTFVYRWSSQRHHLTFTGAWSIVFQFFCLSLSFASLYISNDHLSLSLLIIGVIASRIGLYSFKLTITQMMQQMIPEDIRGIIGGVQKSLNGIFDLATYGLGLIFSKPDEFHILVATGFTSVGIATCLYIWGIHKYQNVITC